MDRRSDHQAASRKPRLADKEKRLLAEEARRKLAATAQAEDTWSGAWRSERVFRRHAIWHYLRERCQMTLPQITERDGLAGHAVVSAALGRAQKDKQRTRAMNKALEAAGR